MAAFPRSAVHQLARIDAADTNRREIPQCFSTNLRKLGWLHRCLPNHERIHPAKIPADAPNCQPQYTIHKMVRTSDHTKHGC